MSDKKTIKDLEYKNFELHERVRKLEMALLKIKAQLTKAPILLNVDIKEDRPHKAIRFYNPQGMACGFGKMKVNDTRMAGDQTDMFSESGYVMYEGEIDIIKLLEKQGK